MENNKTLQKIINNTVLCIPLLLYSCNSCDTKDKLVTITEHSIDTTQLKELELKDYVIDPTKSSIIKCEKGTIIYYFANTLVNSKQEIVKDSVTVQLVECYEPSDFIEQNVTTEYVGSSLQTFGAIFISFNQNGEDLKLKENELLQIAYPKKHKAKNVKLYQGNKENGHISWNKELPNKKVDWFKYASESGDPTDSLNYYVFTSNVTSWLNCDQLLKNTETTTIALNLDTFKSANVHLIYPTLKVIEYPVLVNNQIIFENAPINKPAILFGYSKIGEDYYMYYKELTLTPNQKIDPVFIKTTKEEIMKKSDSIKWDENPEV